MTMHAETDVRATPDDGLYRYAVFGAVLAGAGLPIYIHAPTFFAGEYGLSLTVIGSALFGLRILDFVQDPILGWIADNLGPWRGLAAAATTALLAAAMIALFAIEPPIAPLWWFVGCLVVLFTAFSFLWILFYARGIARGEAMGHGGPLRLAAWREGGTLTGICIAAIVPSLLILTDLASPLAIFAVGFAACAAVAAWLMAPEWNRPVTRKDGGLRKLLADPVLRRLLVVGLFNAAPLAVSASLFLFYVEYRLGSAAAAGPLLLVFFLAAAASAPVWSRIAEARGTKWTLIVAMVLAIGSFSFAVFLGEGDAMLFGVICLFSGAALGADMTLLPALFSHNVDRVQGGGGQAFGLWNFCSKFTLALAAATVLPVLDGAGFTPDGPNPPSVLLALTLLYAVVPSVLKIMALGVLVWTPIEED